MARAEGPSCKGSDVYLSLNTNPSLAGKAGQQCSTPELLVRKPRHTLRYPSLQPIGGTAEVQNKNTCLKVGETARLFYKDNAKDTAMYLPE